jgi:hypothetical protein
MVFFAEVFFLAAFFFMAFSGDITARERRKYGRVYGNCQGLVITWVRASYRSEVEKRRGCGYLGAMC